MTDVDSTDAEIRPFRIDISQADLDDLHDRLARTRWTNELPPEERGGGVQTGPVLPARRDGTRLHPSPALLGRQLVGPAGTRQPVGQVVEIGLGDVDPERLDPTTCVACAAFGTVIRVVHDVP